jgi:hypothetical protein
MKKARLATSIAIAIGLGAVTALPASAVVERSNAVIKPGVTFDGGARAGAGIEFTSRHTMRIHNVRVEDLCPGDDLGAFGQVFVEFLDGSTAHTKRWQDYDGCDTAASTWETKPAPPNPQNKVMRAAWIRVCLFDGDTNRVMKCKRGDTVFNRHL